MRILTISGSSRRNSTNTNLLRHLEKLAPDNIKIKSCNIIADLPIFSPDGERDSAPEQVAQFIEQIQNSDGIIISSPEYVRAIPGGLKNAIDWLVSGEAIIDKPIIIIHASHRGDDMLQSLRLVLSTISANFNKDIFTRIPLMSKSNDQMEELLNSPEATEKLENILFEFTQFIKQTKA